MVSAVEQWSARKLAAFIFLLCVCFVVFFVIGGSGPRPTSAHLLLFRPCLFKNLMPSVGDLTEECKGPDRFPLSDMSAAPKGTHKGSIILHAMIPHNPYKMSRWFHVIMSTIRLEVEDRIEGANADIPGKATLIFTVSLSGRDDEDGEWQLLKISRGTRDVVCSGKHMVCEDVPFFQLHSVYYKRYLINLQIRSLKEKSVGKMHLRDVWFSVVHWNPGFSKNFLSIRTVLFPISLLLLVWYGYQTFGKGRQSWLLERLTFTLGVSLVILNLPVDWIALSVDAPGLTLWTDIRQGFFYAMMCCFWLIFVSEHVYEEKPSNSLKGYWKFILPIFLTCLAALVYGLAERGMQIRDPFYTVWTTDDVVYLVWAFIILIACLGGIFGIVLIVLVSMAVLRVYRNRQTSSDRKTKGFRLGFLLIATLITGLLTIAGWITMSVTESQLSSGGSLELSSAFITGTYGLWNLYTFAVMILFSPAKARDDYTEINTLELVDTPKNKDDSRRRLVPGTSRDESTSL